MGKRIFSIVLILAVVLGMAPVMQQPSAAVSTQTSGVRFPSGVASYEAECPACRKTVTWTPYNGENSTGANALTASSTSAHFHLYLDKDQTYAPGKYFLVAYRNTCLNLNGYNLTASEGSSAAFAGARLYNFIDTYGGSVISGYSGNDGAAGIHCNSLNGDYHLYGGTWKMLDSSSEDACIINMFIKGGVITMHDGAVIDGSNGKAITIGGSINGSKLQTASFKVLGGLIKGDIAVGIEGEANTNCAIANMLGGVVDGNISLCNGADFTLTGGEITGKVTAATGTTLTLSGEPSIEGGLSLAQDVIADISDLTQAAKIVVDPVANGAKLTTAREDAHTLANVFTATEGAILPGRDNAFYSLVNGIAILDSQGKATLYESAEEATAAYYADNGFENGSVLFPVSDQTITLAGDAYVDAAGNALTIKGSGKLYGIDSSNDSYRACAAWTILDEVVPQFDVTSPISGNRYIALENGDSLSYHRLELALTHVTLRPTQDPGMYYVALIGCDEALSALIAGYGTALSLKAMPGKDFAQQADVKYTVYDRDDFTNLYQDNQVITNSCLLKGILKVKNRVSVNTDNVKLPVYANLYLTLQLGTETVTLLADENNIGKTVLSQDFDGTAYSFLQLLDAVNKQWSTLYQAYKQAVQEVFMYWTPYLNEDTFPVMGGNLHVGFGRANTTPTNSQPLAGYGNTHKRMSTSVQTQLYTTCVAITDRYDETFLLFSNDLINSSWTADITAAVTAATGIPEDHIIVAATHTHAAPDPISTLECLLKYKTELFIPQAVAAAKAALADRCEAYAYTGSTTLEKMNTVRHYLMGDGTYAGDNFGTFSGNTIVAPAEKADNELQVIKFTREGSQDVVMVNWQAHPTLSTGSKYYKISADIVGSTREHFEENTGDLFVYFSGACGNVNPESKISSENITEDFWLYGELLSQAAIDVTKNMQQADTIKAKGKTLTYRGKISHILEDKLDQALEVKAVFTEDGKTAADKLAKQYGFYNYWHANGVITRSKYGEYNDFNICVLTLGDISFAVAPYEMFSSHGQYIKENTPGMTFILTSANGYEGYIPNTKSYDYGCYESYVGKYTRLTGDELAQTYVDMLCALAE